MPEFDAQVAGSTDSVMIWADDRIAATVAALTLARQRSSNVTWLDIRDPIGATEPYDTLLREAIDRDRAYRTASPSELAPDNAAANLATWTVIRADEPSEVVAQFVDFLRLPPSVQQMFEQFGLPETLPTLVVTNSDRLASFYPESVEGTRAFVEVFGRSGVKLVSSLVGIERADRFAYRHVFHVASPRGGPWSEALVTSETRTAPPGTAGHSPTRLGDVPGVRDLAR